jgi:hypothetical protein
VKLKDATEEQAWIATYAAAVASRRDDPEDVADYAVEYLRERRSTPEPGKAEESK